MNNLQTCESPVEAVSQLNGTPDRVLDIQIGDHTCTAEICIPNAYDNIAIHYQEQLPHGLSALVSSEGLAQPFRHFGVRLRFPVATQLEIYDREYVLIEEIKSLISTYGVVMLENVYMSGTCRNEGQRNIFPDLDFHFDRSPSQANRYSLYCRDPFDDIQRAQRDSSTLIIPNVAAYLQQLKEGFPADQCKRAMYRIFKNEEIDPLINTIMVEQQWRAPEGVGEICLIDNRTVYHASYYRYGKGYPIGVRYLY